MTQSFSTGMSTVERDLETSVAPVLASGTDAQGQPKSAEHVASAAPESAKLHTVRGLNGWTLYCIEDGDADEGLAIIERLVPTNELVTAVWRLGGDEATVLSVEPYCRPTLSPAFLQTMSDALSDAAVAQLGSWGVDAFKLY